MADTTLRLTRAQLAEFLPDSRAIKAFENMFVAVGDTIPIDIIVIIKSVDEVLQLAESAESKASLALGLVEDTNSALLQVLNKPSMDSDISALEARLIELTNKVNGMQEMLIPEEPEEVLIPNQASNPILNRLRVLGPIYPSSTNGIVGTTTNDSAVAGSVGEIVTANQTVSVALTSATSANVISMSLTPGQWLVYGTVDITAAASTATTDLAGGISVTSAALTAVDNTFIGIPGTSGIHYRVPVPVMTLQLATTTTVYLVARATFTVSTCGAIGKITAVRTR